MVIIILICHFYLTAYDFLSKIIVLIFVFGFLLLQIYHGSHIAISIVSIGLSEFLFIQLDAVKVGGVGIVVIASNYRADAFYKCWRLANIEALFKANDYLTSIDRRHISLPQKETITESTQIEVSDFCRQTLGQWYSSHPSSYLYADPLETYSEHIEDSWKNTPAFYPVSDIDDTLIEFQTDVFMNEKRTTKSYRYLCIGVAIGKEKNYIVHHTRCGETPWAEVIERNTIGSVQQRINKANELTPNPGAKRSISNALMVCSSLPQFVALFSATQTSGHDSQKRKYNIGAPYDSVCIIPVCPSGAMQLRGLLERSPIDFERAVCSFLLQFDGFAKRPSGGELYDYIYPISYHETPVFIGHTMDWNKLTIARDHYEEGRKFYVSCYPEQAKYIRAIMPNVEFL